MVYLYRKRIGKKDYYYLRASIKKDGKLVTKDIAYLGNDPNELMDNLDKLPQQYKKDIRKAYRTLKRFVQVNRYLQKAKALKLKEDSLLDKNQYLDVEACKIHWQEEIANLHPKTKEEALKNFIIEFAFNTAAIEGNTITLNEARKLLEEQRAPKDRTLREIYDLQNTESVFFKLLRTLPEITHELVQQIHTNLLHNIDDRTGYRTQDVRVFKARFQSTPAQYVKTDMGILLQWLKKNDTLHPLVLATAFHHKFEKIHPFMDGNGRSGRMLANLILLKKKYPPLIYRKKNRKTYLVSLSKADKSDLDSLDQKNYADLLSFSSKEYVDNYWRVFL